MESQIKKNERTPQEELQFEYINKLIASLDLEIQLDYSTTEQCARQLGRELEETGYCPEARQYIEYRLSGMVDDTVDNEIDAYLRRVDFEFDMHERGITDFTYPSPEDHPEYPELEQLWRELAILKRRMKASWKT